MGQYAWRVEVGDGTVRYFEDKVDAEEFHRSAVDRRLAVTTSPIPLPLSVAEFVHFLERQEADRRITRTTLAEIERLTPDWRRFHSLPEAVEHAIRGGKQ